MRSAQEPHCPRHARATQAGTKGVTAALGTDTGLRVPSRGFPFGNCETPGPCPPCLVLPHESPACASLKAWAGAALPRKEPVVWSRQAPYGSPPLAILGPSVDMTTRLPDPATQPPSSGSRCARHILHQLPPRWERPLHRFRRAPSLGQRRTGTLGQAPRCGGHGNRQPRSSKPASGA